MQGEEGFNKNHSNDSIPICSDITHSRVLLGESDKARHGEGDGGLGAKNQETQKMERARERGEYHAPKKPSFPDSMF